MSFIPKALLRLSETEEVRLPSLPRVNWRAVWGWSIRGLRLLWTLPFYAGGWIVGMVIGAMKLALAGVIEGYKDGKRL